MLRPQTSVIIATYNAGDYLSVAIKSVLQQTTGDLELIVVDDGSTDGSTDCVHTINDKRLRYVYQENAGQTKAKNRGIAEAVGEFVGFCDADDYWYPDKLEKQLPLFSVSSEVGVVFSLAQKIDESGSPTDSEWAMPYRGRVLEQLFMHNFVPFGTSIVRRACLEKVGLFDNDLRMGIDWDLWLRIATHYNFDFVDEPTYAYRVWPGQMSTDWRGRYDSAFRIMNKYVAANPGVISPQLLRKARANTFAMKGRARVFEMPGAAICDSLRSISMDPAELFNWKTVVRVVIDAARSKEKIENDSWRAERYAFLKNIFAPVVRRTTNHLPRIFMYHRFGEKTSGRSLGVNDFRRQIAYLAENCTVLPLIEAIEHGPNISGGKPIVTITVDDGYVDFLDFAVPILREFGVCATLFVTSGFIDGKLYLWPDRIRAILQNTASGLYELGGFWHGRKLRVSGGHDIEINWHELAGLLIREGDSVRDAAINALAQATGVNLDEIDMSQYSALSWNDLRYLKDQGFEIGDHTWSHTYLPSQNRDELVTQLARSKNCIENNLGLAVRSFAYPNGLAKDYNKSVIEAVRNLGYDMAVTAVPTRHDPRFPFQIGRMSGICSQERFVNLVAGFGFLASKSPSSAKA